jgi:hypothetical protein
VAYFDALLDYTVASVRNSARGVKFFKAAFVTIEAYRLDSPDGGVIAKPSVQRAEFWVG